MAVVAASLVVVRQLVVETGLVVLGGGVAPGGGHVMKIAAFLVVVRYALEVSVEVGVVGGRGVAPRAAGRPGLRVSLSHGLRRCPARHQSLQEPGVERSRCHLTAPAWNNQNNAALTTQNGWRRL